ncbi:MAG TPA: acyl-CoA reductase [Polyangiaceae bacterium LLY-WYZ-15_(1-7)]|nr:hypothetical protein [Sandaracinus sp.]HJL00466.1 acyl-CoA reductase [Polyangiaceae bacterium LLY-WYZ-15_(1-7)]HJL07107.1 acyl-CoA reductase [Polyangiaceae bacterium LLY-WYZ-15_(1-7)]HJL21640.1 acyl-CoA reductase [Polyangiaceae bacterium LLY-WYZ-15_(1-7)]HJL37842.1 acyl-CoA reductase [Polyangiaceae bacterium LLY-WYZ-15_(1-7)]
MSAYRDAPAEAIDALARRLRDRAPVELDADWASDKLADAAQRLVGDEPLVQAIAERAALAPELVRWGIATTAEGVRRDALRRLREDAGLGERARPNRARLAVVALAGNVFSACVRPILLALLHELPVLVRASSRDDVLARALVARLPAPFDEAAAVVGFPRDDAAAWAALLRHADVVHAYGGDAALRAMRDATPLQARFVPHGHGLGVAALRGEPDEVDAGALEALAEDVAAYDQRGCLSPQLLLCRAPARLAPRLLEALDALGRRWPLGPRSSAQDAATSQWRGTAAALGTLLEGEHAALAIETGTPLPLPPGRRQLVVRSCPDEAALTPALAAFGPTLKALGAHDPRRPTAAVPHALATLPAGVAPRVSEWGQMQRPPIEAWLDGFPPSEGLLWRAGE